MEAIALHGLVHDRISELLRYRQWCRSQANAALWTPLRFEYEAELRALLKLAREARRQAAREAERRDAMTQAKALMDRHADCDCHHINREASSREYPADYWDGDHYLRPAAGA